MKKFILLFFVLSIFNNTFSQTITGDTLRARNYLLKADKLKENSKPDSSLIYLTKAEDIYLKYRLNKAYLECELKRSSVFLNKNDLNKALEILNTGEQKVINLFGKNTDLFADFCDKKGMAYLYAKKYGDAKKMWIDALVLRKKIFGEEHYKVSVSYNNLGFLYAETGEYFRSLKLYKKALKIREEILSPNDLRIASALINTGNAYLKIDNPDFALKYFLKALAIKTKKSDLFDPQLVSFYINTGDTYNILGMFDNALKFYDKGLSINQHNFGENNPDAAQIYAKKAVVLNLKGDNDNALLLNNKALEIFKNTYGEEHRTIAKVMQNIGTDYLCKDETTKAVEYFNNSLELRKKIYGIWSLKTAEAYTAIGEIMEDNAEYNAAVSYFSNALKILRNVYKTDNHPEIAESLIHIGNAYKEDEEYYSALENYNKALAIRESISGNKNPETARIYYLTAKVYEAKRGYSAELKNLQKALISNVENFYSDNINFNPDLSNEGSFYYNEKLLFETLNAKAEAFSNNFLRTNDPENLKKACKVYESVDIILNSMKNSASGKKDSVYVKESMSSAYNKAAGICMQLFKKTHESKYYNKAFVFSEKNKRSVLMSLPGANKFEGIPVSVSERETDLIVEKSYYRKRIIQNPSDTAIKQKLISLIKKQQSFMNMSETNYPNYYKFKYEPFSVSVSDIQNAINDSTIVIDYFSAESSKYIYVFQIEKKGTDIHFIKKTDDFKNRVLNFRKHLLSTGENDMTAFANEGYALYKDLIHGISENDTTIKQLVIIPDGILGMIPFEALLTEEYYGNWSSFKDYPFLIKKFAVSYSLSADLLPKFFYKDTIANTDSVYTDSLENIDSIYMDDWVGVAPVFDNMNINKTSKRTRNILKKAQKSFQANTRTHLLSGDNISYLPGSENEVTAIYNEFENHEKSPETEIREEADEEFVKLIDSEEFKFINIVSHVFINSENPEFSGILLAHNNKDDNDGVLFMNEMFDLELNSDLIVLPACETGIKAYQRGEGMIGMTRALLYTGTKNIIFSLWQVSDESTEKLMIDFYKDILNNYHYPFGYNQFLRAAKLKLIEGGEYAHPYYWSPFILIGN